MSEQQTTDPVLSYATPQVQRQRALFSISAFVTTLVLAAVAAFVFVFVVPLFGQIFRDFGINLPGMTIMVLSISRWFVRSHGWLACLAMPVGMGFLGALIENCLNTTAHQPRIRVPWLRIGAILLMLLFALIIVALSMPLMSLGQSLR